MACQVSARRSVSWSASAVGSSSSGRDALAHVHQGLAAGVADATLASRLEQSVCVVDGAHVQDRRGATQQQFGDAESRRCAQRVRIVRGLERPDVLAQPRQQALILGEAPKERLAQMHVTLDQAGHDHASTDVDGAVGGRAAVRVREVGDTALGIDQDVRDGQRAERVHRDERAAAQRERDGLRCHDRPSRHTRSPGAGRDSGAPRRPPEIRRSRARRMTRGGPYVRGTSEHRRRVDMCRR